MQERRTRAYGSGFGSVVLACMALSGAARVDGQLANASTAALGMGENFSAVARGYDAVAWNPAALGLSGNPETSGMIGSTRMYGGMGPVGLIELTRYAEATVPVRVREQWLADITQAGRQGGGAGGDVTWATVQYRRFALQVSTSARAANDISPGFAELLLFGGVDESGNPKPLDLSRAEIDATVYSSIALSYGMPILVQADGSRLAVGVTAKHTMGHVLAASERIIVETTAEPAAVEVEFPIAYSPIVREGRSHQLKSGSGSGVDVAIAYERGAFAVAAVAQNIINTFAWNPDELRYRPAELVFTESGSSTSFEPAPLSTAPASLRERVAAMQFHPSWSVGAMLRPIEKLTLAADARIGATTGIASRPPVHAGAGAEYRPLRWLPLQLGAAYVRTAPERDGVQFTGGVGVRRGGFTFAVSGAHRKLAAEGENALMVTFLSHSFNGSGR